MLIRCIESWRSDVKQLIQHTIQIRMRVYEQPASRRGCAHRRFTAEEGHEGGTEVVEGDADCASMEARSTDELGANGKLRVVLSSIRYTEYHIVLCYGNFHQYQDSHTKLCGLLIQRLPQITWPRDGRDDATTTWSRCSVGRQDAILSKMRCS